MLIIRKQTQNISRKPIQNKPNVLIILNMTPFMKKNKKEKTTY